MLIRIKSGDRNSEEAVKHHCQPSAASYLLGEAGVVIGLAGHAAEVDALSVAKVEASPPRCGTDVILDLEALHANAAHAAAAQSARGFPLHIRSANSFQGTRSYVRLDGCCSANELRDGDFVGCRRAS